MKKLLPLLLVAVFASCAPSRYMECPRNVTGIQPSDTFSAMLQVSSNRPMRVVYAIPGYVVLNADTTYLDRNKKALDQRLTVWNFKVTSTKKL